MVRNLSVESRSNGVLQYKSFWGPVNGGSVEPACWFALLLLAVPIISCEPDPRAMECNCSSGFFARGEHCLCTLGVADENPLRRRIFSSFIKQAPDVKIDGNVKVKRGSARVWFDDKDSMRHELIVTPEEPAKLTGRPGAERAAGSDDVTFSLNLQAVEGTPPRAEGISVEFDYSVGD